MPSGSTKAETPLHDPNMTTKAQPKKTDILPALRHCVFADLLALLPVASHGQTETFMANLASCRLVFNCTAYASRERQKGIDRVFSRLMTLRVSPDIAEAAAYRGLSKHEIELTLSRKYGDRLGEVAGFYFKNRWRVNLPENCALYGYRNRIGFFTGILCQPLDRIDFYFLLSSAKYGGERSLRLEEKDRDFFEQFKEPAIPPIPPPYPQAELTYDDYVAIAKSVAAKSRHNFRARV